MKRPLLSALALIASVTVAACGPKDGQGGARGPAEVGVVIAEVRSTPLTTELSGRTSAFLVSEVRPQVTGIIRKRLFQEGAYVRAGQSLYQIDPATYQATYASAGAGLAQAEAALQAAKLKADRYKELVAIDAVSRQDNDDAQAAAKQAAANVAAQRAAVQQARIGVAYTRVASPISGRIGRSSVTPGALVTAGQPEPLATVQDLSKIYVDVTQSASEMLRLRREMAGGKLGGAGSAPVSLILEDGSTYPLPGRLQFSDLSVDPGTGSVNLRAVFPNPDTVLLPGMYVRAVVTTGAADAILAPQAAVSRDAKGQATLMVVGAGDKVEVRPIEVRQTIGDQWLVTKGLKPGDRIIVRGLQFVQPGAVVKAVSATPAAKG